MSLPTELFTKGVCMYNLKKSLNIDNDNAREINCLNQLADKLQLPCDR